MRLVPRVGSPRALLRLFQVVRAERAGVFHAHLNWPLACRSALLVAKALRVPSRVATVQLFIGGPWPVQGPIQRLVIAPSVGRFIAVSSGVAAQLESFFGIPPQKIRVVPNGICISRFRNVEPARLAKSPVVFTAARLDQQKGLGFLLEAAAAVPEATFVIAGDGPEAPALARQARALGVSERVHFLGRREDIPSLLAGCDVFALPSLNEGFPLAVLEALASARAVVTTAIPGITEIVDDGETGLLVRPGDSASLASAIRSLLAQPDRAQQLGAAGRRRVEQAFSAEAMVRAVEAIYEELLPAGQARSRRSAS
jgi:glycosyltransferase involved in cell wall biosynthesis